MFDGIISFIVVFGTLGLISWSFFTVTVSQISNIEKAFGLSSSESGWLLTIWEVGYVVCSVFASYFAPRANLPRVIGIVTVMCGLSGFVFALPHFIAFSDSNAFLADNQNETRESDVNDVSLCVNTTLALNMTISESSTTTLVHFTKGSSKTIAYALFNIAMIIQGAGKAPCYPYSAQYVDDNVDKQKTGFYIGTISSIAVFGLAIGYGFGSLISSVYVTLQTTTLSSTDPRYIGAWWLGFIVVGFATILIAIPMFCFPRKMTSNKTETSHHREQRHHISFVHEIKHVKSTLLAIIKSFVYVLNLAAACFHILSLSVFMGFEPKYMETQFAIPQWQVNIILGAISITSYSLGCLVGGFITKKWDLSPFKTLLLITFLVSVVTLMLVGAAFLGCRHQEIYYSPTSQAYLSEGRNCDCNASEFLPVCGNDGKNYFSPCHAGCTVLTGNKLTNCSAIPGDNASIGLCSSHCNMLLPYLVAKFIMNMLDAIASIPIFLVFLRSAGEENKALAIGLSAAITSLGAYLPGPVIGGKLIDSTCLIWNTARTSGKYCAYYNIKLQRFGIHGLMIGLRIVALVLFGAALVKARKLRHWLKEETIKCETVNTNENGQPLGHVASIEHDKVNTELLEETQG